MLWFILAAGVLLLAALAFMLRPFFRSPGDAGEGLPDSEIYRRQIVEIDADLAAGNITPEEAETARTEVTRRLLGAADREMIDAAPRRRTGSNRPLFAGLVVLLSAGTIGIYLWAGRPDSINGLPQQQAAGPNGSPHTADELTSDVVKLQEKLKQDPKNVTGLVLLGRTLASLQRFDEAADAFGRAIAVSPDDPALHAQLGEVLTIKANDQVSPAAAAEFTKAGNDPRARYYLALAAAQSGDTKGAAQQLRALLKDSPPDAPWRPLVSDRLAELTGAPASPGQQAEAPSNAGQQADAPPPSDTATSASSIAPQGVGPNAADMAAAAQMSPEARQAMIRTMVGRLAAQVEQNPGDKAGWDRLARAYDVLGEPDKATAARARATGASSAPAPSSSSSQSAETSAAAAPAKPAETADQHIHSVRDHLASAPQDDAAWIELARTYRAVGREDEARAALKQANQKIPGNINLLSAYADTLAGQIKGEKLPGEFVTIMSQINALNPDQTDALWYLGLAAAQRGDRHRAEVLWRHLVSLLPEKDPERASVEHRLQTLP